MRKCILSILILASFTTFGQTIPKDTIYYDSDWNVISDSVFAMYYRVIENNTQSRNYKDFYITGEVEGIGKYVKIDSDNDSLSIKDGVWIKYYKSGKIKEKGKRENGRRQDDFFFYNEDGYLTIHARYLDDELHGIFETYTNDGICIQEEFYNGKSQHDYLVLTSKDGLYSKVNKSDWRPIYSTPTIEDCQEEFIGGVKWSYYSLDGINVGMTYEKINDYGKYYRVYVKLINNSLYPIIFDPEEVVAHLTDKKGYSKNLEIQSALQYDKRIRRTQKWEEFLVAFGNGLAASNAGYSTSTSYLNANNTYGYMTTTNYDPVVAQQAILETRKRTQEFIDDNLGFRNKRNEGYLKKTTVYPNELVYGYFNIKRKKGNELLIIFNIEGAEFPFHWNIQQ